MPETIALTVGEPDVAGALAVFPIFGAVPVLEYTSFAEGRSHGVTVKEMPGGASVNDLLIDNPTKLGVLLYEGEELIGAQQNRTVDLAVLVPALSTTKIAVSCVEQSRWDGSRHGEAFSPSPQAAYPELRAVKSRRAREAMAGGLEARALQGEVWAHVAAKADELAAPSPTGAMSDIYEQRRDRVDEIRAAVTRRDGQVGALAAVGGRFAVLDFVSRPDVFAALHAPLVRGYALDAVGRDGDAVPSPADAEAFVARSIAGPFASGPSAGAGETVRFDDGGVGGTGLMVDGELIQLCAYSGETVPGATRIRRPSRRR